MCYSSNMDMMMMMTACLAYVNTQLDFLYPNILNTGGKIPK